MLETSLITATRDHFDRRERRMQTHFILPPEARNNSIVAFNRVKTIAYVSSCWLASNINCLNNISVCRVCLFKLTWELYSEGGRIFVLKSQPALPSFFPSVEAMMGAWEFSWSERNEKRRWFPGTELSNQSVQISDHCIVYIHSRWSLSLFSRCALGNQSMTMLNR